MNQKSSIAEFDFHSYARFLRIVRFLEPMYLNVECRRLAVGMSVSNFALNREFFSFVRLYVVEERSNPSSFDQNRKKSAIFDFSLIISR